MNKRSTWQFVGLAILFAYYGRILGILARGCSAYYDSSPSFIGALPAILFKFKCSWWPYPLAVVACVYAAISICGRKPEEHLLYVAKVLLAIGTFFTAVTAISYIEGIINPFNQ